MITWLSFLAIQALVVVLVLVELRRRSASRRQGAIMIAAGVLLATANLIWLVTDGAEGKSFIPMRGGVLGFWLSLLTAAEVTAFGLLVVARGRQG